MAEEPQNVDETGQELGNQIEKQTQSRPNKEKIPPRVLLVSIIILVILLILGGGWLGYKHFLAPHEEEKKTESDETKNAEPAGNFFVAVPDIVVNLRSTKPKGNILRTTFILQIYSKEDEPKIKEFMPIILDQVLSYLRDQSINDVEGPGLERMRQAILLRINNIVRPLKVHRVVLKDFIIQ